VTHAAWWLPARARVPVFWTLTALAIAYSLALGAQGAPLRTAQAKRGIVSYELAWTAAGADTIIGSWRGREPVARRQLALDFGFLLLYPLPFALGAAMLADRSRGRSASVGAAISWVVLAAAPLDAAENLALLHMLDDGATDAAARIAALCASAKFVVLLAAAAYLVWRGAATLLARRAI
jgi:hypothetical protein